MAHPPQQFAEPAKGSPFASPDPFPLAPDRVAHPAPDCDNALDWPLPVASSSNRRRIRRCPDRCSLPPSAACKAENFRAKYPNRMWQIRAAANPTPLPRASTDRQSLRSSTAWTHPWKFSMPDESAPRPLRDETRRHPTIAQPMQDHSHTALRPHRTPNDSAAAAQWPRAPALAADISPMLRDPSHMPAPDEPRDAPR